MRCFSYHSACWVILHVFFWTWFFQNQNFFQNSFRNTNMILIRPVIWSGLFSVKQLWSWSDPSFGQACSLSNSFDPDQARHLVAPVLCQTALILNRPVIWSGLFSVKQLWSWSGQSFGWPVLCQTVCKKLSAEDTSRQRIKSKLWIL